MAATAVVTAVLWVLVASVDNDVVVTMAQPWWDDPVRLIALAGLPLTVLAAHGFSELQRWLRTLLDARVFHPRDLHPSARAAATAVAVIVAFCVASGGFYVRSNTDLVGRAIGHGQVVTPHEARAMLELGKLAAPGEWAMNDRYDGTVWTYALSGVRTVAGHFGGALLPSDAKLLAERFNQYPHDPQVRAAVQRLNIRWVIVGRKGFLPNFGRQPGMTDLHGTPFLREVYRNPDAVIYRIVGAPPVHETDHGQDIAPVAER